MLPNLFKFLNDFNHSNAACANCFSEGIESLVGGTKVRIKSEAGIVTSHGTQIRNCLSIELDIRLNELQILFEAVGGI